MNRWVIALIIAILVLCGCVIFACALTGGLAAIGLVNTPTREFLPSPTIVEEILPSPTVEIKTPVKTPQPAELAPKVPTVEEFRTPVAQNANETLNTLEQAVVPNSDPNDLAQRLKGIENIPTILPTIPVETFQEGQRKEFWATNMDRNESFQVKATLRKIGVHVYFWVEDGIKVNQRDVDKLVQTFDTKIYPTDREFFGSEWTPGIDGDPHLFIVYARDLGQHIGGYFSSVDSLNPLVHKYSNSHEMFFINADNEKLYEEYTYGTLAHEFQHMIHWYRDRNEDSWVNEGFSMLAELLNGYDVGGFDVLYASDPDISLTDWPDDPDTTPAHYGASFLFLDYFLSRFGENATKALVADQENGMVGIDHVLKDLKITDPQSNKLITADDVFADWAVTNYLQDGSVADGRYTYSNYPHAPSTFDTEAFSNCPINWQDRTVNQYGVDYIDISCAGNYNLRFEGSKEARVVPIDPHSGQYMYWSNKGDESDMTLTHYFDFRNVSGPITLSYFTWYDIEKDYDYLYLVASEDGTRWKILKTPSGTDRDPSGNSYGWGYSGKSKGWIQEKVDISQFVGKEVQLRFEYVTDAAVNGESFLLDDVSIPEIGYSTDFEQDDGGWKGAGFVRIQNRLPQTFRLTLIKKSYGKVTVEPIPLDVNETATISLDFGKDADQAILVVSGTMRFTRQTADYRFSATK